MFKKLNKSVVFKKIFNFENIMGQRYVACVVGQVMI